jgi:hypothetical protein
MNLTLDSERQKSLWLTAGGPSRRRKAFKATKDSVKYCDFMVRAIAAKVIVLEISSRNARVKALQKRWDRLRDGFDKLLGTGRPAFQVEGLPRGGRMLSSPNRQVEPKTSCSPQSRWEKLALVMTLPELEEWPAKMKAFREGAECAAQNASRLIANEKVSMRIDELDEWQRQELKEIGRQVRLRAFNGRGIRYPPSGARSPAATASANRR